MWLQTELDMIQIHLHNNMQEWWSHQQAASYTRKADKHLKINKPDTGSRLAGSLVEESKLATNEKLIQPVVRVLASVLSRMYGVGVGKKELVDNKANKLYSTHPYLKSCFSFFYKIWIKLVCCYSQCCNFNLEINTTAKFTGIYFT